MRAIAWLLVAGLVGCGRTHHDSEDAGDGAIGGGGSAATSAGAKGNGVAGGGAAASGASAGDAATEGGVASGGTTIGGAAMGGSAAGGELPVDPSLPTPRLRLPQNGRATGSVWTERALRPRFAWGAEAAVTFELQVDDSCEAGSIQSCDFASPEWTSSGLSENEATPTMGLPVSTQAPVGRRYYWRVRSCTSAACSPWSPVRYVDVGRQQSDLDGDGFGDVVVSDMGTIARQGRVLVAFGPSPSGRKLVLKDDVAPETGDHFGQVAKVIGDVDADGFADLLVTAPQTREDVPGVAYVYFGSATFDDASSRTRLRLQAEPGASLDGTAAAAGDIDADGRKDFVIDSPPAGPRLFRSLGRTVSMASLSIGQPGTWQQTSLGDVTGDGFADLLVVSATTGPSTARYDLLRGTAEGLGDATLLYETLYPTPWWSVVADVNGDGLSDIASAFNETPDTAGHHIEVTWGAEKPLLDASPVTWAGGLTGPYATVGATIAAGDVNGDGFEDSLTGIEWHTSDLAQANLYLGGMGSRTAPDAVYSFNTGTVLYVLPGLPSAAGDVNGDGFDDVLVAEDWGSSAKLYLGAASLDNTPDDELALPPP